MTATTETLPGFTVRPNAYDVRIECDVCHESKSGSLARAWAGSHSCAMTEVVDPDALPCAECGQAPCVEDLGGAR